MNFELFAPEPNSNLLPYDGIVEDYGLILTHAESQDYFDYFLEALAWKQDEMILYGQYFKTGRKVVWYGDQNYQYHYSGMDKQAQIWDLKLLVLKQKIELITGVQFNSCLANLYEDGTQGVGWHSDDEAALRDPEHGETVIASLSLGATRKFRFKHRDKTHTVEIYLQSGQLIVMKGQTQRFWKHTLAKSTKVLEPRINLTFRYFYPR